HALAQDPRHRARRDGEAVRGRGRGLPRARDPARDRSPGRRAVHRPVVAAAAPIPEARARCARARRAARGLFAARRPGRRLALTRPRVVFMGTPEFAVPALRAVARACDVAAVVTQPDRPRGRGQHAAASAVASEAESLGLTVLKPADVNALESRARLRELAPDLLAVVAYGMILEPESLALGRLGAIDPDGSPPAENARDL